MIFPIFRKFVLLFQRRAHVSACADKVLALQMLEEMQQEEGLETLVDEGN